MDEGIKWGVAALGAAGVASFVFSALMRFLAPRLGWVDRPRDDRHHRQETALGGGLAWVLAALMTGFVPLMCATWGMLPGSLEDHIPGMLSKAAPLALLAAGALMLMLMGLRDDMTPVPMGVKLALETVLGVLVYVFIPDARVTAFLEGTWFSLPATVLWVVFWTNVFNLLDHADGMSSSAGICVSLGVAWLAYSTGQIFIFFLAMVLAGSLGGFLLHNFPPARLFMGDAGSLPLGYLMGLLLALHTFYDASHSPWSILTPLCLTLVPLYDVMSVMWLRFREGRPLWLGDRRHVAHRLQARGWGQRRVLFCLMLTGILGAGLAWGVGTLPWPWVLVPAFMIPGLMVLMWSLERPR